MRFLAHEDIARANCTGGAVDATIGNVTFQMARGLDQARKDVDVGGSRGREFFFRGQGARHFDVINSAQPARPLTDWFIPKQERSHDAQHALDGALAEIDNALTVDCHPLATFRRKSEG